MADEGVRAYLSSPEGEDLLEAIGLALARFDVSDPARTEAVFEAMARHFEGRGLSAGTIEQIKARVWGGGG